MSEHEECYKRANEFNKEVKAVLGDRFILSQFLPSHNQPRTLVHRTELLPDCVGVGFTEVLADNYKETIKSRIVESMKKQIAELEEAVEKLEAYNVKPS